MRKKLLALFLVLTVVLAGCGATGNDDTPAGDTTLNLESIPAQIEALEYEGEPLFGTLVQETDESLETILGIDPSLLEEHLVMTPMMIVHSSMIMILRPVEGSMDEVRAQADDYMTRLEEQWSTYLVDQYELVQNRSVEEHGPYLIYVISRDNQAVLDIIKGS